LIFEVLILNTTSCYKNPCYCISIFTAEDAEKAASLGVDGILVSNHGARQLDTVLATVGLLKCFVLIL
jgi:isopentenyl diphosphate isomerase/L-lactate dehydrogenase-like FMN-dependent dehydrogenase